MSKKRQRIERRMRPIREKFKLDHPNCWGCRQARTAEIHEIIRGSNRLSGIQYPGNWVALCPRCHWRIHDEICLTSQYAICAQHNPFYDRRAINRLRGRHSEAITESEVEAARIKLYPSEGKDSNMIVLTRKEGEKIDIGNEIQIIVLQLMGNKVRLGIQAPDDVIIMRSELERHDRDEE